MDTSKPLWLKEPGPDQTSIRFCCPYCFIWVRNREFEDHIKSAHTQADKILHADVPIKQ